jgi:D-3-phosphoglycerate dehydrogenase / 2-oxoglutarate reductase
MPVTITAISKRKVFPNGRFTAKADSKSNNPVGQILVTPRSVTTAGHPSLARLADAGHTIVFGPPGRHPTEEELVELLPPCIGYLAGVERITLRVLEAATDLRAISRNGAGVDNIDLAAARARGIAVSRAEGANARGVAELTIAFLLALARRLPFSDASLKNGKWERAGGIELEGKTLGLIGCGRVGRLAAEMALGMGMQVLAFDPKPDASFHPSPRFRFAEISEVLSLADFLSFHCPPAPGGGPLLNAETLRKTKRGVFVVNTARFDLFDADALLKALDDGHVAGVAIDVFDHEPPDDFSLVKHPRVIATPHIGGFTQESIDRAMNDSVDNLLRALEMTNP